MAEDDGYGCAFVLWLLVIAIVAFGLHRYGLIN